jgi:hypothetical protein
MNKEKPFNKNNNTSLNNKRLSQHTKHPNKNANINIKNSVNSEASKHTCTNNLMF